jgi:hypothetical protein
MFKKIKDGFSDLSWTLAGTALVLITLSGDTQKWGIWISATALAFYFFGLLISSNED